MKSPREFVITAESTADTTTVFAWLTDWPAHGVPGTTVRVTNDRSGLGCQFTARTQFWRFGFDDTMVVTTWRPPVLPGDEGVCVVTKQGPWLRGYARLEVHAVAASADDASAAEATMVTWREAVWCGSGLVASVTNVAAAWVGPAIFGPLVRALLARGRQSRGRLGSAAPVR